MPNGKQSLRLWLRLLTCSNMVEREVRTRLRHDFAATLPRFDMMAALDRAKHSPTMGELSDNLMVSNGNVTGVADRLVKDGLIKRTLSSSDGRSYRAKLTKRGQNTFTPMADQHETWIEDMLSGLNSEEQEKLMRLLNKLKTSLDKKGRDAA